MFDRSCLMDSSVEPPPLPPSLVTPPRYCCAKFGAVLALLVILACAVYVVLAHSVERGEVDHTPATSPNRMLELVGRYAVGVKGLMQQTGQWKPELTGAMLDGTENLARSDADALRVLILKGWLNEAWPPAPDLDAIALKNDSLQRDVKAIQAMMSAQGKVEEEEWKRLLLRHGWIVRLMRAQTNEGDVAGRDILVKEATVTAMTLLAGGMMGMLAAVAGVVLMFLAISRIRSGKIRFALVPRTRETGGLLLEGFAIYLSLFLVLPMGLRALSPELPRWAAYASMLVALGGGMAWPLLRGMTRTLWRDSLGLHRGAGVWREVGAGLLGWLAGLPLMILGMIAASWIIKYTGEYPSHPIIEVFAGNAWAKLGAVVLAVVWAPVSEEIMLCGLLFPVLSAWLRWLLGAVSGAFIFAVIHPQGWAGVPAIMALAIAFSMLRMWRQSLIAPMTAHALNNGIMCAMMLMMW